MKKRDIALKNVNSWIECKKCYHYVIAKREEELKKTKQAKGGIKEIGKIKFERE